jgi:hypothetical protein
MNQLKNLLVLLLLIDVYVLHLYNLRFYKRAQARVGMQNFLIKEASQHYSTYFTSLAEVHVRHARMEKSSK